MINGLADPPDTPEPPAALTHEPEKDMVRIVVRMTRAQYDALYRHVTAHRTTMSAFGRLAIGEKMGRV